MEGISFGWLMNALSDEAPSYPPSPIGRLSKWGP
jgi:hypothetical protein